MSDDDLLAQAKGLAEWLGEPEELDPELQDYYEMGPLGPMIRHPLVYSMFHTDRFNGVVNRSLREKKEGVADALKRRQWGRFIWLHERPWRIDAFTNICWRMGDKEYWEILRTIWTDTENLHQNRAEWESALTAYRRYRNHLMSPDERGILASYRSPLTVFRGYHGDREHWNGLSWTINQVVAKFFAHRLAEPSEPRYIAAGKVRKRNVIAYLESRSEYEVIGLPENVFDMQVDRVEPTKAR